MTTEVGGVVVKILGDDSDLNKKLTDSAKNVAKWGAAAAAAAAVGTIAITKETAAAAKEVENLSRLLGISSTEFQRNAAAAKSVGIEQDKLADIYKDTSDKVGDFLTTGAGPMIDYFEKVAPKIGQTAEEFRNLSGPQALQKYMDGLEEANLSQSEMTFFMEAIASDATLLIPLLADGGAEFERLGERADAAGAILSAIDIEKLNQLTVSVAQGQEQFKGFTNQLAVQFAPILQGVTQLFADNAGGAFDMRKAVEKAYDIVITGAGFAADALNGVQVVVKGLEVIFWGLQAGALVVFRTILEGLDFMANSFRATVNAMIDGVNLIPGIELDKMVTGQGVATKIIADLADAAKGIMAEAAQEFQDLALAPPPSSALNAWVSAVETAAQTAAENTAAKKTEALTGLLVPSLVGTADDPEVIATREKYNAMRAFLTEYAVDVGNLGAALSADQVAAAKETADKLAAVEEAANAAKIGLASSVFGDLSSLMNTENKKLFEVGKVAAIGQAVVDGYAAAVSAYKFGNSIGGPIAGAAAAGASVLATGAMIADLVGTQYGGGAKSPSVSAGGSAAATPAAAPVAPAAPASEQVLRLETVDPSAFVSGQVVNQLAESLVQYQKDGFQLVVG
ncbi:MAG: hypothetical protein KAT00_00095 [Planctomycetes bacterium]|nr:hypothetical protein [Planctomycetota bacterium]